MRVPTIGVSLLVLISPAHGTFSPWNPETANIQTNSLRSNNSDDVCPSVDKSNTAADNAKLKKWRWPFGISKRSHHDTQGSTTVSDGAHEDGALHQIDHRAKEKISIAFSEKMADQVVKKSEQQVEKLAERASGRVERYVALAAGVLFGLY